MKVAGRWRYVYRAIDQFGQVIDVFVSPRRDGIAAAVLERALGATGITPVEVITDHAAACPVKCTRRNYCQRTWFAAPTDTPITGSNVITVG